MNIRVISIPAEIAAEARATLRSPQYTSLRADVSIANGYGPCRSCLKVFDQSTDERIYLTYNSFEGLSDLPSPGPIFIHKNVCEAFDGDHFPPDLVDLPLLFEGFGENSRLIAREEAEIDDLEGQISRIFETGNTKFINIRNAEAGCFIARIELASWKGPVPIKRRTILQVVSQDTT
jgi:hypothetical protein